jgi:carbamoyl-phosphate synthase large subunit
MRRNILLTSAGRRVELLQAFRDNATALSHEIGVFGADLKPALSSACRAADAFFPLPRVTDSGYIDKLLSLCVENEIGMVVPTIDTELAVLAENRLLFESRGVHLVISDADLVRKCRDKRLTGEFFQSHGISYPRIYPSSDLEFPCFVKPYNGSSSIGAAALMGPDALTSEMMTNQSLIFMELIDSHYVEYTVDAYFDRNGKLHCLVPRKRIETRAGEVSKGVTRKNFVHARLLEVFKHVSGARGCLTIQVFVDEASEDIIGLEVNPRFGGGYPLSYSAGATFPLWLMQEYLQAIEPAAHDNWEPNLLMLRYDAKVLVHDYA